ncbi:hypothetical protein [Fibrobacter sp.]|uniref:hypothetical protein n=1 Tax=Fibrobacter sp. TaxID=35828 RepID=UPI0038635F9E
MDRKLIEEKFNKGSKMADFLEKTHKEIIDPTVTQMKTKILKLRFKTMDDAYLLRCTDENGTRYEFCMHFPEDGDKMRAYHLPPEIDIVGFIQSTLASFDDTPILLALGEE